MASLVAALNIRPSRIFTPGRASMPMGDIPLTWMFEKVLPSERAMLISEMSSGDTYGLPAALRSGPGIASICSAWSRMMTLCISACEPTRMAMTLRVEAVTESVRVTPCTSASTHRKTATTKAITNAVIPVEVFLATRLRRLYLSGIAMSHDLSQTVDDLQPGRADRRHEPGQDPDSDGDGEGHDQRLRRHTEVGEPRRNRRLVPSRDEDGNEDVHGEEHPENASQQRHHYRLRKDEAQNVPAAETERAHDGDFGDALASRHRDRVGDDQRDGEKDDERNGVDQELDVAHHLHELKLKLLLRQGLRRGIAVLEHFVDGRGDARYVVPARDLQVVEARVLVRAEPGRLIQVLVVKKDVPLVAGRVGPDVDEIGVDRNVGALEDDVVALFPVELVGDLLARDEAAARRFPLGVDFRIDCRVVEDLVEVDVGIGRELADPVLRLVVLVDAAKPDLRRHGDHTRDLLDPLALGERQEVAEAGRVLHDEPVGALSA